MGKQKTLFVWGFSMGRRREGKKEKEEEEEETQDVQVEEIEPGICLQFPPTIFTVTILRTPTAGKAVNVCFLQGNALNHA